MHLHQYTAGVLFNRHYFNALDIKGDIIDAILGEYENNKYLKNNSLAKVSTDRASDQVFVLLGEDDKSQFAFKTNQIIFKKSTADSETLLSAEKVH